MSGWPSFTVRELQDDGVLYVVDGNHGQDRPRPDEFVDEGSAFIRASDLANGQVMFDQASRINDLALRRIRKGFGAPGDVLFSHKGTVGKLARVPLDAPPFVCSPQTTLWRVLDETKLRRDYLYAFMRSRAFIDQWWVRKGETDMADYVSLTAQRQLRVTVPPVDVQARIAAPLAAIDDLIEKNRRRVEVLEKMAKAIYREWFVHFRYPGHEDATFVDSPLGPIPEGWEVKPLHDAAALVRGRSYRKNELVDEGGLPFVNLKCMMRGGGFRRDGLKRYDGQFKEEQLVRAGDVVLAVTDLTQGREILARATLVPQLPGGVGVISLDVARIVASVPEDRLWTFAALRWSDFADRVKEFANGSTVLHLSPIHVAEGDIIWPTKGLREQFVALLEPVTLAIDDLNDAAEHLASIRDVLLPKLVTGQIDVSSLDLDAAVEASVA